jgi:sec-independent protein translocase protein TatB
MFDFGSGELVVIGVVALVAIGPKELPGLLRTVGQAVNRLRRMAGDFQNQFNEAMREADMADAQKMISDIKSDFSTTMTGSGSMSPPIVTNTSSDETETASGEGGTQSEQALALETVADPEPVTEFPTQESTSETRADDAAQDATAPKPQTGAA